MFFALKLLFFFAIYLNTIGCTYHPSFFKEDELRHIRDVADHEEESNTIITLQEACDENQLIDFLADIQVFNPESIIAIAVDGINPLCRKVQKSLLTIRAFLRTCTPPPRTNLYMTLITGLKKLYEKLCVAPEFFTKFQNVFPCLHDLRDDYESCNGPADWNESVEEEKVCKYYKDISDCYYIKTSEVCGEAAATTMKDLLITVINSILKVSCPDVKLDPEVLDSMPEAYIKQANKKDNLLSKGEIYIPSSPTQTTIFTLIIILYSLRLYFF